MKLFFFISTLVISLASCSKNPNNQSLNQNEPNDVVVFEQLTIRTSSVGGVNTIPSSALDFATIIPKQMATQELIITNGDSSSLVFGSGDIDASDIAPFIMNESCSNKNIERNRSCKLTFSLMNNPSQTETVLTKSFTIKGTTIQLTATLAADSNTVNSNLIVAPRLLDFGLMRDGDVKELSIVVSNRDLVTRNVDISSIINPKLSIVSNTCSSLPRSRTCSIRVRYTASTNEEVSQQAFTLISNNEIRHSVLVQTPAINQPQILSVVPSVSTSNISLTEPQNVTQRVTFTNTGLLSLPAPVQLVASPTEGVSVDFVSCTGGLSRGRSCSVSYSLNSALLAVGMSQVTLKLKSGSLESNPHTINLNVTKAAIACTLVNAAANGINLAGVSTVTGTVPNCFVETCNENDYTKETLGSTPNRCATLQRVYQVQLASGYPFDRLGMFETYGVEFFIHPWRYLNSSYKIIDGGSPIQIAADVPVPINTSSNQIFTFGSNNCALMPGSKIPAGGNCDIWLNISSVPNSTEIIQDYVSAFQIQKPHGLGVDSVSQPVKKLLPKTVNKTSISLVVPSIRLSNWETNLAADSDWTNIDPGTKEGPLTRQGQQNIRGATFALKNLQTAEISYFGPCNVKSDGSIGDPRGVHPFVSEGNVRQLRTIGNKVLFTGKGCTSTGSGVVYSNFALWEYDADQSVSQTNPRQISRIANMNVNWAEDGAPKEDMLVLDGKLYYQGVSEIGDALNGSNDYRKALLVYDPSLQIQRDQFDLNPNPKEIFTGYDRYITGTPVYSGYFQGGASSYPSSITQNNGKIYMFGTYFRGSGSNAPEYHNGVIEYDPAFPYNVGDPGALEATDNPKFIWGYREAEYALSHFENWPSRSLFVDEDYIVVGAHMPRNENPVNNPCDATAYPSNASNPSLCDTNGLYIGDYNNLFLGQLRDDRGQEITFIHRSTNTITKPNLCPSCSGRPTSIRKVGNHYLFTSQVQPDVLEVRDPLPPQNIIVPYREGNRRMFKAEPQAGGTVVVQGFDTNLNATENSSFDIFRNRWNFNIVISGTNAYMPLVTSATTVRLHKFDGISGLLSPIGPEYTATNAGEELELHSNNVLSYRGTNSIELLDLNLPISTILSERAGVSANPKNKAGVFHHTIIEKDDFFYEMRGATSCPLAGTGAPGSFYVDFFTKERDTSLAPANLTSFGARCLVTDGSDSFYRYRPMELLLIKDN